MSIQLMTALPDDSPTTTVFVVEDDPSLRDLLSCLIQSIGFSVEMFASAEEFLRGHDAQRPGCLLLDVRLPGMSGVALQERLNEEHINLPVIMMTGYGEVPTAVYALKHGAIDFIQKPFSNEALLDSVRRAVALDHEWRRAASERAKRRNQIARLTQRERDIMRCMIAGHPNKVIATELGISEKTVEAHRARVMRKLKVGSLAELIRLGLAEFDEAS